MASKAAASAKNPTLVMKRRLIYVVGGLLALFTAYITLNLIKISIVDSKYYQNLANRQQLDVLTIYANRGTIYDTNGKVLAKSATVWQIVISPNDIKAHEPEKRELIAKGLAEILELDYETILEKTHNDNKWTIIKKKVEGPENDRISQFIVDNGITSIHQVQDTKRYYPNGTLAANVIGFTGDENTGLYGIEAYYEKYLSGVNGRLVSAQDAGGNEMPYRYEKLYDPENGSDLILTVDEVLQHYLEKNLEKTVNQHKVKNRATGIMMNVNTGAILAMATTPSFDLNEPFTIYDDEAAAYVKELYEKLDAQSTLPQEERNAEITSEYVNAQRLAALEAQWKNKAITELYYPGSVFKVITAASALEVGAIERNTNFTCNHSYTVSGTVFHCWKGGGHGTVDLQRALIVSCNPYFMQVGQKLGVDNFTNYFKSFGLAERTGIDLPGETGSLYYTADRMGQVELVSSSFGQSNKITPMQMVTAYAAAINGGYLVTPHVVDKILDNEGNTVFTADENVKRQVVSNETSDIMKELLQNVVEANGGINAYIKGYKIGGKSGTSEKQDQTVVTGVDAYMSSFVGFAPADNPEIIMLVMVDEPTGGQIYGSAVAAPVVSAVFQEALPYLGHYPQYTEEELKTLEVTVPYVIGKGKLNAQAALAAQGLKCKIVGDGDNVIKQYPYTGSPIPYDGMVVLYTEDIADEMVTVPNVIGLSVTQANTAITNAGLNIKLSGGAINNAAATASTQSVNAGEKVRRGTIIDVMFLVQENDGVT